MATTTIETPACMFCGKSSRVDIPVPAAKALAAGALIQDALPAMPAPERELVRSGIHPECWESGFGRG